jgi:hypothetical protein
MLARHALGDLRRVVVEKVYDAGRQFGDRRGLPVDLSQALSVRDRGADAQGAYIVAGWPA